MTDPTTPSRPLALIPEDDGAPPTEYDPADYRWVPVRRRPRYDGWTEEKQRRFIETLADTGLVGDAARAVGMSRESVYRLRRSAHGAAFARAWDAARHHAGGLIEDIAFERAIEGVERDVHGRDGEVIGTKRVYDNRLLGYLLGHLKPERYGGAAVGTAGATGRPVQEPALMLEASLRAMEPPLPAPPEQLLGADDLADALELADAADGALPDFLAERRPPKSAARIAAEEAAAREARGEAAWEKVRTKTPVTDQEFADLCEHIEPGSSKSRGGRVRKGARQA